MSETPRDAEELFDPQVHEPDGTEAFLDPPARISDPKALKKKAISQKVQDFKAENDLRAVLQSPQGVRFVARVIQACGWNMPYFHPSNSVMSETAGRRSIAWQLEQWISNVDLQLWFQVRQELEALRAKPKTSERGDTR